MAAIGRRPAGEPPGDPRTPARSGPSFGEPAATSAMQMSWPARLTSALGFVGLGLAVGVVGGAPGLIAVGAWPGSAARTPTCGCGRRGSGGRLASSVRRRRSSSWSRPPWQAGIPLDAAVAGAARAAGGELADELERSRVALALGRPRGEELRDLSERTGAPTLAALGLALRLSDRLGVPLAESLRGQAERSRAEAARDVAGAGRSRRAPRAGRRRLRARAGGAPADRRGGRAHVAGSPGRALGAAHPNTARRRPMRGRTRQRWASGRRAGSSERRHDDDAREFRSRMPRALGLIVISAVAMVLLGGGARVRGTDLACGQPVRRGRGRAGRRRSGSLPFTGPEPARARRGGRRIAASGVGLRALAQRTPRD